MKTYFIADIGANHDGSLERALELIGLAKKSGADAAKFQHFTAEKIVSKEGFDNIGKTAHQAKWKDGVVAVYKRYSIDPDWTPYLAKKCEEVGIDFFSTPYDFESADVLDPFVDTYKIGSGDITWIDFLQYIARKGKRIILSTGASTIEDVDRAVEAILPINTALTILQCNTNYTGHPDNIDHVHLNVLRTYKKYNLPIGLSDHTGGHVAVIGAVAMGATVIEKHFTDDTKRDGPDHPFAMDPKAWRAMVDDVELLERALGSTDKFVCSNETESAVVQRRCLRAARDIKAGEAIRPDMFDALRPCEKGGVEPWKLQS